MNFTPIDLRSWPRGQMFSYFSKMAPTGYSITVNMDVTELKAAVKEQGYWFCPYHYTIAPVLLMLLPPAGLRHPRRGVPPGRETKRCGTPAGKRMKNRVPAYWRPTPNALPCIFDEADA